MDLEEDLDGDSLKASGDEAGRTKGALGFTFEYVRCSRTRLPAPHDALPGVDGPSALEVLQQRYARGEIDTATFENMRERLVAAGRREDYR